MCSVSGRKANSGQYKCEINIKNTFSTANVWPSVYITLWFCFPLFVSIIYCTALTCRRIYVGLKRWLNYFLPLNVGWSEFQWIYLVTFLWGFVALWLCLTSTTPPLCVNASAGKCFWATVSSTKPLILL